MSGTDGISSLQKALGSLDLTDTKQARAATGPEKTLAGRETSGLSARGFDQASVSAAGGLAGAATSDVRADKVAALQQQIAAGTYKVASGDVAAKLVESLLSGS
jgi:flagellar biosynthesis anti-sigma factor FlgM